MSAYIRGPWQWVYNAQHKTFQLRSESHEIVMDFVRVGMFGAGPRVQSRDNLNLLTNASEFAAVVDGREHHAKWFMGVRHPDLDLIAAAPELAEALANLVDVINAAGLINLSRGVQLGPTVWHVKATDAMEYAGKVLAKAGAK